MAQVILLLMAAASLVDSTQASSLRITHYHNDWTVDSDGTSVHCVMRMVWEKEGVPPIVQSHTLNLLADGIRDSSTCAF